MSEWIRVEDRLPAPGVTVMVYTPPQPEDWPQAVRIEFDAIDPDSDGDYWINHGDHYEHYMAVGGSRAAGPDEVCTGPSEKAPYTHWMPMPALPGESA